MGSDITFLIIALTRARETYIRKTCHYPSIHHSLGLPSHRKSLQMEIGDSRLTAFKVLIDDNFRYQDESERVTHGLSRSRSGELRDQRLGIAGADERVSDPPVTLKLVVSFAVAAIEAAGKAAPNRSAVARRPAAEVKSRAIRARIIRFPSICTAC